MRCIIESCQQAFIYNEEAHCISHTTACVATKSFS